MELVEELGLGTLLSYLSQQGGVDEEERVVRISKMAPQLTEAITTICMFAAAARGDAPWDFSKEGQFVMPRSAAITAACDIGPEVATLFPDFDQEEEGNLDDKPDDEPGKSR